MISRPLSADRNTTLRRPRPARVSFFVSHCTRKPPVSPVNVSVCKFPRPLHAPTGFQTDTASAGGADRDRQPPVTNEEMKATETQSHREDHVGECSGRRNRKDDACDSGRRCRPRSETRTNRKNTKLLRDRALCFCSS